MTGIQACAEILTITLILKANIQVKNAHILVGHRNDPMLTRNEQREYVNQ
jgi:hypothetical protein